MVLDKMPHALIVIKVNETTTLDTKTIIDKCMVASPAIRDDFNNRCRPFIQIDGCHLKGPYKGVFLSKVTRYGNTRIYLLVICICNSKNINT